MRKNFRNDTDEKTGVNDGTDAAVGVHAQHHNELATKSDLIVLSDVRPVDPPVGTVRIGLPVDAPFDPLDLAPSLWLRDSDWTGADGDVVVMTDASGNGNDPASTGADPHLETTGFNGHNAIRLDGFYVTVPGIVSDTPARTIFVVGQRAGGAGNQRLLAFTDVSSIFDNGGAWGYYATQASGIEAIGSPSTDPSLITVRFNSAASADVWLNGVLVGNFNPDDSFQSGTDTLKIGRDVSGDYFYGLFGGVFVVDSALSDDNVDLMNAWYTDRFALA